ncbi:MAG: hypothetical protein IJX46_09460 [Clostridia bacterium]|nr:hypothetical protein [Clostridia bacterium]
MTLTEKAAYIKGLAEGLNLNTESAEGKLINALIDMVTELAAAQNDTDEDLEYLNDYIEEIDEDLGALEEEVYECECDCDDECDCEDCDCDCDDCNCDCDCCDDGFEITCPACGETIVFDGEIDPEDLSCPACHEKLVCECDEDED